MRISLVQPPQGTSFGFTKVLMVEPLGLECVAAALTPHDHEAHILDLRLDRPSALVRHLQDKRPHAVGIACGFTTDVYSSLETARLVKRTSPATYVFVGGHHASLIPGDFLFEKSPVDAVVVGEGEWTTRDLADALERGDDPGAVAGVMTRENDATFTVRPMPRDLDELPLPARHLTKRYRKKYHHGFAVPSACVETSRGCPFDCNFCSIWVFYQRRARRRSADRIVEDLEQVKRLGEDHVFFTDDIAFLQHDAYEQLGRAIEHAGLAMHYSAETRADLVVKYRDLFKQWKAIGMNTIFLGIEKIDDRGLDSVRKRTKGGADTNRLAIEILRSEGITPMTSLIADPAWDERDFDRLEEFVKLLDLPNPTFTVLTPLPGTELWETVKSEITTDDYGYFDVMHLVLPSKLPPTRFYERFARLYRLAEIRSQFGLDALISLIRMGLKGQGFVVRRVYGAVRDMRSPRKYLSYPGSTPRPNFVPAGYGAMGWVDKSRSHLAEKVAM